MLTSALLSLTLAAAPATVDGMRDCAERAEPAAPDAARVTEPLRMFTKGLERLTARDLKRRNGAYARVKAPVDVLHSEVVTLRVAAGSRSRVALDYELSKGKRRDLSDGQRSVTFFACPAHEENFRGNGTVGLRTAFPGGLIVTGPTCAHLRVLVDGEARWRDLRVGIGKRCPR